MHHPLGKLLEQEHMLKPEDLERVEGVCERLHCSFEEAVTRLDLLTEETLQAFKEHLPTLALSQMVEVDPQLVEILPAALARRHRCVPIASLGRALTVALADPSDRDTLTELSSALGRPVDAVPALEADLDQVLRMFYGDSPDDHSPDPTAPRTGPAGGEGNPPPEHTRAEVVMESSGEDVPEPVALANRLLALLSVREGERLVVRWIGDTQSSATLFDGEGRHGLARISPALAAQVIQRYRVLADLLMASRQHPQEGSFRVPLRFEDGSREERAFQLQIVPLGDQEGETATLTPAASAQARPEGTVETDAAREACPGCDEPHILPGFHYCPLCGIRVD